MSFEKYKQKLKEGYKEATKIEWLNPDDSVNSEFTNDVYSLEVNLSVSYTNGCRRTCTITLNNNENKFHVNYNNIWFGQKFKLWRGIYLDDETPYYFPQGVFYVSNPQDTYNPDTKTLTINGIDKWAFLDGSLFGILPGTYQTNIGDDLFEATKKLLRASRYDNDFSETNIPSEMLDPVMPYFPESLTSKKVAINGKETDAILCPYTAIVERGKTYADILLEYATILCANVYYDVNGRLTFEPMIDVADDITDTNKEIVWHFTVEEKNLAGLSRSSNFEQIYNDFIVLGNVLNGYQFKGRVQNRNPFSETCVQRIGLKTKEPYEDNQYTSDEQCIELAKYYAKTYTILQRSVDISSTPLFHLDVNKLVTISTPSNGMSKELFLITGYSLQGSSSAMTINVTSVNILDNFSIVTANNIGGEQEDE